MKLTTHNLWTFQGGGYNAAAPGFYQRNNANPSYQERRQSMEETLSKFMRYYRKEDLEAYLALLKPTRESCQVRFRHCKADSYSMRRKKDPYGPHSQKLNSIWRASHIDNSIPRKEKDLGSFTLPCYINNVCFDNALADLGVSLRRDQVDDLMTTIEEGEWWKIWMATEIKTWEILFLENRSAKLHVWKQKGLMD
ncbi:hypothetical protein Tco_0467464 [Tanacetum coccineum]